MLNKQIIRTVATCCFFIFLSCLAIAAPKPQPLDPQCEKLLPSSVAEKVSGISPLKMVGRFQVKAAGGTCNYVKGDDLVFIFTIDPDGGSSKNWPVRYGQNSMYKSKKSLTGLGSESFITAEGALIVRKADKVVSFGNFYDKKTFKLLVPEDKLIDLGKTIVDKI